MLTMTNAPKITDVLGNPLICHLVNLELERDDFVIFGSAPLLVHGLRQSVSDLDVVARGAAWRRASELGVPAVGTISGSPAFHLDHGRIQIFSEWISKAQADATAAQGHGGYPRPYRAAELRRSVNS